jgi:hypothetical protein
MRGVTLCTTQRVPRCVWSLASAACLWMRTTSCYLRVHRPWYLLVCLSLRFSVCLCAHVRGERALRGGGPQVWDLRQRKAVREYSGAQSDFVSDFAFVDAQHTLLATRHAARPSTK